MAAIPERCLRHPDEVAEFSFVTHYTGPNADLTSALRSEQVFGGYCAGCRLEFTEWATTPASSGSDAS